MTGSDLITIAWKISHQPTWLKMTSAERKAVVALLKVAATTQPEPTP